LQIFQICTLVNDPAAYAEMKRSFIEAGFDEGRCTYTVFDNYSDNRYDPYDCINQVLSDEVADSSQNLAPYVIFAHQDLLLDQGHGIEQLRSKLAELDDHDGNWAIAGNAGVTDNMVLIRHVSDLHGASFDDNLPRPVITLDENLLIIKRSANLRCSSNIGGFHLYASDLCLYALMHYKTAYVIDFRLTHLGQGNINENFYAVQRKFQSRWNPHFLTAFIQTPCTTFALTRYGGIRRWLDTARATNYVVAHPWIYRLLLHLNRKFASRSTNDDQRRV